LYHLIIIANEKKYGQIQNKWVNKCLIIIIKLIHILIENTEIMKWSNMKK